MPLKATKLRIRKLAGTLFPAFLSVVLFGVAIFWFILPSTEEAIITQKKQAVKELVNIAWSVLGHYHKQELAGLISHDEAQARAMINLANMRYGPQGKDYFWINDLKPVLIMHPYRPDLVGSSLPAHKDRHGNLLLGEFVKIAKKQGAGWVFYDWQWKDDPSREVPKLSYIKLFKPWGWIVGTGLYVDDVHAEMVALTKGLFLVGGVALVLVIMLAGYISWRGIRLEEAKFVASEALRQSEKKFRFAFDHSSIGMALVDIRGHVLSVNQAICKIFDHLPSELMKKNLAGIIHPDDLKEALRGFESLARGHKENFKAELRCIHRTGRTIWSSLDISLVRDQEGKPLYTIFQLRDNTDRKLAERALRRSEATLRSIHQGAPVGIGLISHPERILSWTNQRLAEMTGYSQEELNGFAAINLYENQTEYERVGNAKQAEVSAKGFGSLETRWRRKDGKAIDVLLSVAPVDLANLNYGFVFIVLDITINKAALREKAQLESQLRQSQKMEAIGTLAGGIAHDFNNILGAIMGYTELAMARAQTKCQPPEELENIMAAAVRARDLVSQILTFSRKGETRLVPLDLNQKVRSAVEMLQRTIPKMIDIELDLAEGLKSVMGDPNQLEQVIMNLGSNAQDAMPDGGVLRIKTSAFLLEEDEKRADPNLPPGEYVLLSVSDSGLGMEPGVRRKIFDPFFTTKDVGKGTGLGLSTVYGIVKNHGGALRCHSEPGRGTTFEIFLPAVETPTGRILYEVEFHNAPPAGDETVLLVDDEKALRDVGSAMLETAGYLVITAQNGEDALALYEQQCGDINLVILDLGMPGMGGHKCLAELLRINPEVKVLVASGYSAEGRLGDTLENGAKCIIPKPYSGQDLLNAVRSVLDMG